MQVAGYGLRAARSRLQPPSVLTHGRVRSRAHRHFLRELTTIHPAGAAVLRHSSPPGVHLPSARLIYAGSVLACCARCLLSAILSNCLVRFSLKVGPILCFLSGRPIFHMLANSSASPLFRRANHCPHPCNRIVFPLCAAQHSRGGQGEVSQFSPTRFPTSPKHLALAKIEQACYS